jgi:hypothetical protein
LSYYKRYIKAIGNAKWNTETLIEFQEFAGDENLDKVNMLDVALEMNSMVTFKDERFVEIITELGVCYTTSSFYDYQLPYNRNHEMPLNTPELEELCVSNEVCTVIFVISGSAKKYTNYIVSIHQYFNPPNIILKFPSTYTTPMKSSLATTASKKSYTRSKSAILLSK